MQNIKLETLIPSIVSLIVFVANGIGKPVDQMTVTQLVTAVASLVGVILGIVASHRKDTQSAPPSSSIQPPSQP